MECKVLTKIFDINEPFYPSKYRTKFFEVLLTLGKAKQVSIEFKDKYCNHSAKPSQIFWRDIPIMEIKCLGNEINFQIQNDREKTLFFLLRQLVQLSSARYITILIQLRLPSWKKSHEFIFVLNSVGESFIIPTDFNFSSMELKKLLKIVMIQTEKKIDDEQDFDLIDILSPDTETFHEFKIRF